ncbi:hypothetical protein ES319_A10G195300v1 [Gossypium barbadense]|uniref:Uncharacterized protein n=1 Tax=Gossypium barbadense TaxID=3634 RepID=A0A5J5U5P8_GOSBA|nr:hypothetical protein ES319_A10G195300v1 [Gossypium barbadense]
MANGADDGQIWYTPTEEKRRLWSEGLGGAFFERYLLMSCAIYVFNMLNVLVVRTW